ncbi:hypothetical protein GCM10027435_22120 [Haloparvum alkalitolerans]|uniref:DUF7544 domain-containing protein n=1 Tax=Haloparvum alkalitolerans TaxID=1042953 RepID=UPI003CECA2CB
MSWSALDALSDSVDASKRLLLPFDLRRWLTLAVIVFFVSGVSGPSGLNLNAGGSTSDPGGGGTGIPGTGQIPTDAAPGAFDPGLGLVLLVVGLVLAVGIAFAFVGAVMQFVFVEAARTEEPRVRGVFGDYLREGLQLFLLRLAVWLLAVGSLVAAVALVAVSFGAFLLVLLLASPVLLLLALLTWLFLLFTTDFVVPIMVADDVGILAGWRRFWGELRAEWREYAVYALARVVVSIGAGIVAGMGAALVGIVLAIPFVIVGIVGYLAFQVVGLTLVGLAVAAVVAAGFVAAFLVASTTLVQVPVATYLRYYSLLVLGDVSPQFDLIPEIRADVVDADEGEAAAENGNGGNDAESENDRADENENDRADENENDRAEKSENDRADEGEFGSNAGSETGGDDGEENDRDDGRP